MARPRKLPSEKATPFSFTLYPQDAAILGRLGGHNKSDVMRALIQAADTGEGRRIVELEAANAVLTEENLTLKLDLEELTNRLESRVMPLPHNATPFDRAHRQIALAFPALGPMHRRMMAKAVVGAWRPAGTLWQAIVSETCGTEEKTRDAMDRLRTEIAA